MRFEIPNPDFVLVTGVRFLLIDDSAADVSFFPLTLVRGIV
jgi:hypothetical protein